MKDFDYIIIGGGCAGLSLAYELQINKKLDNKSLAIIEPRSEYKWEHFSVNISSETNYLKSNTYPYQSINSGLFYEKVNRNLEENRNINFFKNIKEISTENSFIFNSVPSLENRNNNLWQHFCGVEIETKKNIFDDSIINLMAFNCEQRNSVHFFYTLPYSKNKALVETTWLSKMSDDQEKDYDNQIKNYIKNNLNIKNYNIVYKEKGVIPLFYPSNKNEKNIRTK